MNQDVTEQIRVLDLKRRAKNECKHVDEGVVLRAIGMRDEIHPHDAYATVCRDAALAEKVAQLNRDEYGHEVIGPVMLDGGMVTVLDLRPALASMSRDEKVRPYVAADPALPDDYFRRT